MIYPSAYHRSDRAICSVSSIVPDPENILTDDIANTQTQIRRLANLIEYKCMCLLKKIDRVEKKSSDYKTIDGRSKE